jgi:glycosyltransferase involved in cell wall biosynthesis
VIASLTGGITEVIDSPGHNGVLVPPGDLEAIAAAAARLLADADGRQRMGEAARRRIEEEYTIERMVERTTTVYEIARRRFGAQE